MGINIQLALQILVRELLLVGLSVAVLQESEFNNRATRTVNDHRCLQSTLIDLFLHITALKYSSIPKY